MEKNKKTKTKPQLNAYGVFCSVLAALFIFGKFDTTSEIHDWSWLWVLAPIWMPIVILIAVFFVVFISAIVVNIGKEK
jgi:hypothetical protein